MKVAVAVVADAANIATGGKLNVMGMFDRINAPQFPVLFPLMAFVLRMRMEFEDGSREHDLTVSLRDEDGDELLRAGGKIGITDIEPGLFGHSNLILNFAGVVFRKPGVYYFDVRWGKDQSFEVPLQARLVEAPTPS